MRRLPKDKISLSIYVTPQCKEKLECLQQFYFLAGKRLSLSQIAEEAINTTYAMAYMSLEGPFWKKFFILIKYAGLGREDKEIEETLDILERKNAVTRELLRVPLDTPKDFKSMVKNLFFKDFLKDLKSWLGVK